MSEAALSRYGLKPLARVVSYHVVAVEPTIMGESQSVVASLSESLTRNFPGIGPVEAIRGALAKASLSIKDIDVRLFPSSSRPIA